MFLFNHWNKSCVLFNTFNYPVTRLVIKMGQFAHGLDRPFNIIVLK